MIALIYLKKLLVGLTDFTNSDEQRERGYILLLTNQRVKTSTLHTLFNNKTIKNYR